jgi:TrmH family RNA methyltransferase
MRPAIASKDNPLIKEAATLRMGKYRRKTGLFIVEGEKMAVEAVRANAATRIFASESYLSQSDPSYLDTVGDLIHPVTDRVYQHLSGQKTPCGISAVCRIPERLFDLSGYTRLMILDRVQDPGNVGAVHRICDAVGFDGMVCLSGCADPYGPKAVQAGMGAVFRVPVLAAEGENDGTIVHMVKENGFRLAAGLLDNEAQDALAWSPGEGKWALVIGNESQGIAPWLLDMIDTGLYIPIYGGAESLNAAVAAGILAYRMAGRG